MNGKSKSANQLLFLSPFMKFCFVFLSFFFTLYSFFIFGVNNSYGLLLFSKNKKTKKFYTERTCICTYILKITNGCIKIHMWVNQRHGIFSQNGLFKLLPCNYLQIQNKKQQSKMITLIPHVVWAKE